MTAWNFAPPGSNRLRELVKPAGSNRLRELLKLYGCEDVVTPVNEDAFGRRSSELIRRGRELQRRDEDEAQGNPTSEPSFVRVPKPSAEQRTRDAAAATAEYKAEELATREKTARLRKLRLEKQAADKAKASGSAHHK
jgi:hypothetical protein